MKSLVVATTRKNRATKGQKISCLHIFTRKAAGPKDKIEEKQTGNPKLKDKPRLEARNWQKRRKKETTVILPGLGNAGGRMVGWLVGKLEAHHRLVQIAYVHHRLVQYHEGTLAHKELY